VLIAKHIADGIRLAERLLVSAELLCLGRREHFTLVHHLSFRDCDFLTERRMARIQKLATARHSWLRGAGIVVCQLVRISSRAEAGLESSANRRVGKPAHGISKKLQKRAWSARSSVGWKACPHDGCGFAGSQPGNSASFLPTASRRLLHKNQSDWRLHSVD
jgi:hypothetical protein